MLLTLIPECLIHAAACCSQGETTWIDIKWNLYMWFCGNPSIELLLIVNPCLVYKLPTGAPVPADVIMLNKCYWQVIGWHQNESLDNICHLYAEKFVIVRQKCSKLSTVSLKSLNPKVENKISSSYWDCSAITFSIRSIHHKKSWHKLQKKKPKTNVGTKIPSLESQTSQVCMLLIT